MIQPEKIWNSAHLPTLPTVAIKLLELSDNPDVEISDVINTIQADPAISAKILKSTNSSYFGLSSTVTSIERAVPLLGRTVVTSLALSFSLSESAMNSGPIAEYYKAYWRQSVLQGVAAEILAKSIAPKQASEFFLTGLLMDLGRLAMLKTIPNEYLPVLQQADESPEPLFQLERQALGIDHIEVGIKLMENWKLPAELIDSVRLHHAPLEELLEKQDHAEFDSIRVVALAASIGEFFCSPVNAPAFLRISELAERLFGMSETERESLLGQTIEQLEKLADLFSIDPDEFGEPSDLMAQANQQLAQLAVREHVNSTQAIAREQATAEEKRELESSNQDLQKQAIRDPLTELYNRQFFDETLANELSRCGRAASTVGVLFCDIDNFKRLNDTYGHPFGDLVLKQVSAAVEGVLRTSDTVARYGGEEFVILVTEPTEKGIAKVAERIRQCVESEEVFNDESRVPVTVSIGAAIASPRRDENEIGKKLIAAADEAMYDSKRNGRNQVHVRSLIDDGDRRLAKNVLSHRFSRWIVNHKILDIPTVSTALLNFPKQRIQIGKLAQQLQYLTPADVSSILDAQKQCDSRFGEVAMRLGLLTEDQLALLLALQQEDPAEFNALLIGQGLLERDYAQALLQQYLAESRQTTPPGPATTTLQPSSATSENAAADV